MLVADCKNQVCNSGFNTSHSLLQLTSNIKSEVNSQHRVVDGLVS